MLSLVAMIAYIALPCARCRYEVPGMDFCIDKQSFFHEDTDIDEQAGSVPEEKQMPIKSKPKAIETKESEVPTTGRAPRGAMENNSSTAARKPQSTDKYDDEAMLAKFAEEEDVDREDHVTQLQYLSDLAVNTDSEITSLHAHEEPSETFNFAGADHDPFVAFANDDDASFYNDGIWTRAARDIRSSEEPSSEESDESKMDY